MKISGRKKSFQIKLIEVKNEKIKIFRNFMISKNERECFTWKIFLHHHAVEVGRSGRENENV